MSVMGKHLAEASTAVDIIRGVLTERGLAPMISRAIVAEASDVVWLFAVLDVNNIKRMESYTSQDTIHHISTALRGRKVIISNSSGLRYAILLSRPPKLPSVAEYPGFKPGVLQFGIGHAGPVETTWDRIGHVLVAGMTGVGKTQFLRLIVNQAIDEGHDLIIADPDGRSFPQLSGHPALLHPLASNMEDSAGVIERALAEVTRRQALYAKAAGFPDSLESYNAAAEKPLPRLVVIIDEFNGLISYHGGPKSALSTTVAQIAWMGRKFGVTLILAGQEFSKDTVGKVRPQLLTRVCFRVEAFYTSQLVVDRRGAEKIRTPGRALSSLGLLQAYKPDDLPVAGPGVMTAFERDLGRSLLAEHGGRMTIKNLMLMKIPEREARAMREDWRNRGLAVEGGPDNALMVNTALFDAVSSEPSEPVQTSEPVWTPSEPQNMEAEDEQE